MHLEYRKGFGVIFTRGQHFAVCLVICISALRSALHFYVWIFDVHCIGAFESPCSPPFVCIILYLFDQESRLLLVVESGQYDENPGTAGGIFLQLPNCGKATEDVGTAANLFGVTVCEYVEVRLCTVPAPLDPRSTGPSREEYASGEVLNFCLFGIYAFNILFNGTQIGFVGVPLLYLDVKPALYVVVRKVGEFDPSGPAAVFSRKVREPRVAGRSHPSCTLHFRM